MGIAVNGNKTFVVVFPNQTKESIKNVCTYEIKSKILYLIGNDGEILAVYKKWWSFKIEYKEK